MTANTGSVIAANIKANPMMSLAHAESDIKQVFDLAKKLNAEKIHLTEIVPVYRKIVRRLAKVYGYKPFSAGNETILWRADIKPGRRLSRLFTRGVRKVMPNVNMASVRLYVAPVAEVFGGTHYAPKWWWRPLSNSINNRLARRQIAATKKVVKAKTKAGAFFILAGDLNTPKQLELGEGQTYLAPIKGVMHLVGFAPAGYKITPVSHGWIPTSKTYTDHPIAWATYQRERTRR